MMRRFSSFLLVCFTPLFLYAQEKENPYVITGINDDPNYARFMAQIGIGLETDFHFRTEVPLSAEVRYETKEIPFEFEVSILGSFIGDRRGTFYPNNLSENEFQPYSNFEFGGVFNFSDHSNVEPLLVTIDKKRRRRSSGREELTEYYVVMDGTVRRRWGARWGMFRYAQSITDYDAVGQTIEFPDGTTFPDADNPWEEKPSTDDNYYFTAERHLVGYLGMAFHSSKGLALDVQNHGRRDTEVNLFFYADLLLSVASDIQKLSFGGNLYDLNDATSGVDLNNMGFRVGAKRVDTAIFYSVELGMRPQYFDTKIYTQFLIGYSINRDF